ncbi:MAG TPA: hypothetical protein VFQ24_15550 [Terriglobia bacterium]|nr:hypothetical protein [Terriglobia bacterium]
MLAASFLNPIPFRCATLGAGHVRLMRGTVWRSMGVETAGGTRSLADDLKMLEAGADRLGSTTSARILAAAACLTG